jgi:hypothetical protein
VTKCMETEGQPRSGRSREVKRAGLGIALQQPPQVPRTYSPPELARHSPQHSRPLPQYFQYLGFLRPVSSRPPHSVVSAIPARPDYQPPRPAPLPRPTPPTPCLSNSIPRSLDSSVRRNQESGQEKRNAKTGQGRSSTRSPRCSDSRTRTLIP